jgi:hypothetical protein
MAAGSLGLRRQALSAIRRAASGAVLRERRAGASCCRRAGPGRPRGGWSAIAVAGIVAEKCDRALVALSMRLRVSPQARMRRETTVPKGPPASIYDLMREEDADAE